MSNEYIFFTDQTALTFRICLVYLLPGYSRAHTRQDRQCIYDVTLRHVHASTVAVDKQ